MGDQFPGEDQMYLLRHSTEARLIFLLHNPDHHQILQELSPETTRQTTMLVSLKV